MTRIVSINDVCAHIGARDQACGADERDGLQPAAYNSRLWSTGACPRDSRRSQKPEARWQTRRRREFPVCRLEVTAMTKHGGAANLQ